MEQNQRDRGPACAETGGKIMASKRSLFEKSNQRAAAVTLSHAKLPISK
jgi:hypothetical protein